MMGLILVIVGLVVLICGIVYKSHNPPVGLIATIIGIVLLALGFLFLLTGTDLNQIGVHRDSSWVDPASFRVGAGH